jgi:hypothetical protein
MTSSSPASGDQTIRFEAQVASLEGQLIVHLPPGASEALPSRGQVAVTGSIDDQPFDAVVEPDGRRGHWLKLDGLSPGQVVTLALEPSPTWPEPDLPDDLRSALDAAPDLADLWSSITPMARWEWVRWVRSTRNPATRARRVEVSVSKMRDGKRRPCCFDLSACTDPDLARSGKLLSK